MCVAREHVVVFRDFGRLIAHSTLCGTVWNVKRDGTAKTVRTRDAVIEIEKITGYVEHYVVSATSIDVAKAVEAAQGKESPIDVREAVRPFLLASGPPAHCASGK